MGCQKAVLVMNTVTYCFKERGSRPNVFIAGLDVLTAFDTINQ